MKSATWVLIALPALVFLVLFIAVFVFSKNQLSTFNAAKVPVEFLAMALTWTLFFYLCVILFYFFKSEGLFLKSAVTSIGIFWILPWLLIGLGLVPGIGKAFFFPITFMTKAVYIPAVMALKPLESIQHPRVRVLADPSELGGVITSSPSNKSYLFEDAKVYRALFFAFPERYHFFALSPSEYALSVKKALSLPNLMAGKWTLSYFVAGSFEGRVTALAILDENKNDGKREVWRWDSFLSESSPQNIPGNSLGLKVQTQFVDGDWFLLDDSSLWKVLAANAKLQKMVSIENETLMGITSLGDKFYLLMTKGDQKQFCRYSREFKMEECKNLPRFENVLGRPPTQFFKVGSEIYMSVDSSGIWKVNLNTFEIDLNFDSNLKQSFSEIDQQGVFPDKNLYLIDVAETGLILRYGPWILRTGLEGLAPQPLALEN